MLHCKGSSFSPVESITVQRTVLRAPNANLLSPAEPVHFPDETNMLQRAIPVENALVRQVKTSKKLSLSLMLQH